MVSSSVGTLIDGRDSARNQLDLIPTDGSMLTRKVVVRAVRPVLMMTKVKEAPRFVRNERECATDIE